MVVPTVTLSSKPTVFSTQIAGVGPADGEALGVADGAALLVGLSDGALLG